MNKHILSKIGFFILGAGAGSAVTWKLIKTKYEQQAKEEIESVIESFSKRVEAFEVEKESDDEDGTRQELEDIIDDESYDTVGYEKEEDEEDMDSNKPYVISPEEFGDNDYVIISLTYYTDGTVTNDRGKIVTNVDELVGLDSLNHFGEYEEDSVFVRNDKLKIDFEILKDYRDFSEIS